MAVAGFHKSSYIIYKGIIGRTYRRNLHNDFAQLYRFRCHHYDVSCIVTEICYRHLSGLIAYGTELKCIAIMCRHCHLSIFVGDCIGIKFTCTGIHPAGYIIQNFVCVGIFNLEDKPPVFACRLRKGRDIAYDKHQKSKGQPLHIIQVLSDYTASRLLSPLLLRLFLYRRCLSTPPQGRRKSSCKSCVLCRVWFSLCLCCSTYR